MNRIKTFVIFSFLLSTTLFGFNNKDTKTIQKMYQAIDQFESFECSIHYKALEDESDTTTHYSNIRYLKNVNDSLIGYSFVISDGKFSKSIYDGSYLVYLNDEIKHVGIIDDYEGITKNLSSMWTSPFSIKRLLRTCLSSDSIIYKLEKDSKGDFQLKIDLPYFNLDGYLPLDMPVMPGQKTEYSIIFDKYSYLPKFHYRNNVGILKYTATFDNFKEVSTYKVSAIDSIPKDYRSNADVAIETDSKNKQATDFKLKQFEGDSLDLYKVDSEYILLEFTNLNCGPCRSAASYLKKRYEDLKNKHIEVIFIDDEDHTNIKSLTKYISDSKLPFRYLVDGSNIAKEYKVLAVPTFFLLNKDKLIIDIKVGYSEDWLNDMLE